MTQAELRNQKFLTKQGFITAAAQCVAAKTIELLGGSRRQLKVELFAKNNNRYFNLQRYCESLSVKIYQSGEIDVTLKEFCHDDITLRLVTYAAAEPDPDAALQCFRDDISILIEDYITGDWHTLMDFLSQQLPGDDGSIDWRSAEKDYRALFSEPSEAK